MWLIQCCLASLVLASRAAYYHVPSMTTLRPPAPLPRDSFFGYSITYHGKSLIVSAPRADLNGQLFSCTLDDAGTKSCGRMNITMDEIPRYNVEDHKAHNHNFWLGATVKASKDNLFVCAPRSTDNIVKKYPPGETYFGTSGICYVKNSAENNFNKLPQIKTKDRYPNFTKYLNENLTDSFGWSIDIEEERFKTWVRVGSPALAAGRVMTYTDTSGAVIPNVFRRSKVNEEGFNFGYSIASGNFFKTLNHGVAVGTPYGDNGVGMVLFYADQSFTQQHEVFDPTGKVGSLFGAALCAAIVKDKTVLLVGSPAYFKDKSYHTGIVYVYKLERNDIIVATKIEGPDNNGAFFGYAIANAGDMDRDKKDEIAIAAPYEDEGRGAVYLYSGSSLEKEGKDLKWLQRFQPKTPEFWNLGLSLTADKYSDHGCYDLAMGAPGNDKVAVYHCLTVITVKISTKFPKLQERTDKTKFKFDLCLNGKFPLKPNYIQAKFRVRVKIIHPNATLTNAKTPQDYEVYEVVLRKNTPKLCREIHVTTAENGDYEQEIQFDIKAQLQDDPVLSTNFDPSRATLSSNSILTANPSISAADCQSATCKPKLTARLTTSMKPKYTIGSSETETINVVVNNGVGDTAYRPCVRVNVSSDGMVTIHRAPPECRIDDHTAICRLQRPLKKNSSWDVSKTQNIELGLTSLTSKNRVVNVSAEVFNRCIMEKADHVATMTRELITDSSSVRIESKTDEGEIVPFNSIDVASGKTIHHTYTIVNAGTNWLDLRCSIQLYKQPYIEYKAPIEVYSGDNQRAPCELPTLDSSDRYHSVNCLLGDLYAKKTIVVVIAITIAPGKLEEVFKKSNGTVETSLKVQFEINELGKKEMTSLVNGGAEVPTWIIIAAAAVGLLILFLIGFALYECGFLRRQNKKKLENLQKEVKRKSMMLQRQSMRLSSSARAELRNHTYRELLDAAEIKEAEESVDAKEGEGNTNGKEARARKGSKTPLIPGLNGNSSVSNQDLRAQIEKSLVQKQKPTPTPRNLAKSKTDEAPFCDENEI